jgi:hypothetical protein
VTAAKGTSIRQTITREAGAILVNAPTLEGWYLLLGQAVAIAGATGMCALLFGGLGRRESKRRAIGIARLEWSRTHRQKEREEYGDGGNRTLATFHGPAPKFEEHGEFGVTLYFAIEVQPFFIRKASDSVLACLPVTRDSMTLRFQNW